MTKISHIEGDCLQVMPTLPRKSFDLLLTDPPYAMPATYYKGKKPQKKWSDTSIMQGWWRMFIAMTLPLMKDGSWLCTFTNANAISVFWPIMYEHLTYMQLSVWDKVSAGPGVPLMTECEFIISGTVGGGKRPNSTLPLSTMFRHKIVPFAHRVHQAQKPALLIEELLSVFCPPDGNVLDPFAGSGVVASVCERTGRSCTSIEWDAGEHQMPQPMLLSAHQPHEEAA